MLKKQKDCKHGGGSTFGPVRRTDTFSGQTNSCVALIWLAISLSCTKPSALFILRAVTLFGRTSLQKWPGIPLVCFWWWYLFLLDLNFYIKKIKYFRIYSQDDKNICIYSLFNLSYLLLWWSRLKVWTSVRTSVLVLPHRERKVAFIVFVLRGFYWIWQTNKGSDFGVKVRGYGLW